MNSKKVKAIRQALAQKGVDVSECKYIGQTTKDKFGRDRIRSLSVAPCVLAQCGRNTYKAAKKFAK